MYKPYWHVLQGSKESLKEKEIEEHYELGERKGRAALMSAVKSSAWLQSLLLNTAIPSAIGGSVEACKKVHSLNLFRRCSHFCGLSALFYSDVANCDRQKNQQPPTSNQYLHSPNCSLWNADWENDGSSISDERALGDS